MSPAKIAGIATAIAACAFMHAAIAQQSWPVKSVRMIVPFSAGGGTDILARLLGKKFQDSMGQSFLVENRAGANGNIGVEAVAKAAPDGYTVLFTSAPIAANATLFKDLPFDTVKDLQPVAVVLSTPLVLFTHPGVPAKSVKELMDLAKKKNGAMNAAHAGNGSTAHMIVEMLKKAAGVEFTNIPYKGGGPAFAALVAGQVDLFFSTAIVGKAFVQSGRVRPLAVTSLGKSSVYPDLPTLSSTYPGLEMELWYMVFFPSATSKDTVAKMNAEVNKALGYAEVREMIAKEGAEPGNTSVTEATAYFRREVDKYARIIRDANIQPGD